MRAINLSSSDAVISGEYHGELRRATSGVLLRACNPTRLAINIDVRGVRAPEQVTGHCAGGSATDEKRSTTDTTCDAIPPRS